MSIKRKYFGTDGVRGMVGTFPITPDFVLKLGWAVGKVLLGEHPGGSKVLIGKDTRISGYMFESALEAGLSAAGIDSCLLGPLPTPAVAYLTRELNAVAGIVISASHNSYHDNGFKIFTSDGKKLPDDVELRIEKYIELKLTTVKSEYLGKATRISDAAQRYVGYCKSTVPTGVSFNGLKIIVDCANGAAYNVAPEIFRELGAHVMEIGTNPDGLNINDGCGSTSTDLLCKSVVRESADLGIALDGDADRVIMVNHLGEIVDGDEILFIIAQFLQRQNKLCGGIVGTLMSNLGLEIAFKELNIPFIRTKVGDRYVIESLLQNKWMLGGETSGHIIRLDLATTGDGIISALQVLNAMINSDKSLGELTSGIKKMPQYMLNIKIKAQFDIDNNKQIQQRVKEAEALLLGSGRIVLRASGTEPVIRVMVEGENKDQIKEIAEQLAEFIESIQ